MGDLDLTLSNSVPLELSSNENLVNSVHFSNFEPCFSSYNNNGESSNLIWRQEETTTTVTTESSSSELKKRKKRSGMDLAVVLDPEKNPDWLPPDWKVVTRTRPNGKSAGTKDTYYYEPIKNRQFRSKREVLEYIAGKTSARSHKKSKNNEETASSLSMKSSQPIKVDLDSPPEKVKWVLGNSSGISWMPFIGDEWVPEHIKLGWAEMFNQA